MALKCFTCRRSSLFQGRASGFSKGLVLSNSPAPTWIETCGGSGDGDHDDMLRVAMARTSRPLQPHHTWSSSPTEQHVQLQRQHQRQTSPKRKKSEHNNKPTATANNNSMSKSKSNSKSGKQPQTNKHERPQSPKARLLFSPSSPRQQILLADDHRIYFGLGTAALRR